MLKFFRKYNKLILAVGGSLLMVVFLLPQALQQVGTGGMDPVVAKIGGRDVTASNVREASVALELYANMMPPLNANQLPPVLQLTGVNFEDGRPDPEHWLLLTTAAKKHGFVGGVQDGRTWIPELAYNFSITRERIIDQQRAQLQALGIDPAQFGYTDIDREAEERAMIEQMSLTIDNVIRNGINRYRPEPGKIEEFLAEARGVVRMYQAYEDAIKLSDVEAIREVRKFFDQARVDYAMIDPEPLIATVPEPTEEEIVAQFEAYRDVPQGQGEHGFGYRQDPVVAAEWIKINRDEIAEIVKLDPLEVSTRYQRDKHLYVGDFKEARPVVERKMKEEKIEETAQHVVRLVQAEILKREPEYKREQGIVQLPEDWLDNRAEFQAVADAVNAELSEEFDAEDVVEVVETANTRGLMDRDAMRALLQTGIGSARQRRGPRSVSFGDLVFNTRELNPDSALEVQIGPVDRRFLTDPDNNMYFYRVLNAKPARPAESVDQVRGLIVADLKRLAAYNKLLDMRETIRTDAIVNFDRVVDDQDATIVSDINVRRGGTINPAIGQPTNNDFNNEDVRTAIMDYVEMLDPRLDALDRGPEKNIIVVPSPDFLQLALVRIESVEPIAVETYRKLEPRVASAVDPEISGFVDEPEWPFSKARLAARLGYTSERKQREEDEAEDAALATGE